MTRILIIAAALGLAAFALWHPAPAPLAVTAPPAPSAVGRPGRGKNGRGHGSPGADSPAVVYVAGAVARPGLYHVRSGDRAGDAIRLAGGPSGGADPWAVNLAARVADGDEIYVPRAGEPAVPAAAKRGRRSRATPAPAGDVDVNIADAPTLARVPGIGRAIAARIVELRERDGRYDSLDELLDAAGMSAARLERARPFLRPP
ncbi:MAG TPA: helix-hairpin-helix domain-containing protein [Candidatus Acidoferrales bacterium]|jgi:competence protein ComEA|nr:helix-hairpin-helix domain-containing protein [Candidatus Acidoferrales bacterium]